MLEQPMPHPRAARGGGELCKAPSPKEDAKGPGSSPVSLLLDNAPETLFQVFKIDSVASVSLRES